MNLIKDINEMAQAEMLSDDHKEVARRLADFWKDRAADMSDDELREAIAMDLENVPGFEGDPEVIDSLVPVVLNMVRGG